MIQRGGGTRLAAETETEARQAAEDWGLIEPGLDFRRIHSNPHGCTINRR
jgi:hypothetical protein